MKKENLIRIFSRMPELETERLILRPMRPADDADMFDYARRADVTQYLLWKPHPGLSYTRSYLEYLVGRYRTGTCYEWAVVLKAENRMIGTCGFASVDTNHNSAELGYVLNPDYRGRGLIPEAATRVLRFGFQVLGLHRIEARYMIENEASLTVMKKLGMRFEGVKRESMLIKGAYRDIGTCAILAKDFRAE